MSALDDIRQERVKKIDALKKAGIDPYPAESQRTHEIKTVIDSFETLEKDSTEITIAGRIMSIRGQGGILFVDIFDGTGRLQTVVKKDEMDEKVFSSFVELVNVSDFIEFSGTLFVTKRGEQSLLATQWRMLAKSLMPVPDEWFGIKDEDERYRKRYLDLLLNDEYRLLFQKKATFWNAMRIFMIERGFLEVETPTLETTTGGAEARPFATHHNDFDIDVYLRISVGELWQKRLMAAGFPKTFEIGRVYRNEGTSPEHLQEFTNLEFYAAYMDYRQGIKLTEELIKEAAQKTFGTLSFSSKGFNFNLEGEWPIIEYVPTVFKMTGIDVLSASEKQLQEKLRELKVEYIGKGKERMIDSLWKYCRKQISGPAWLIDPPKVVSPLAKGKPDNKDLVERVQLVLAGAEMTNGYSELNDAADQRERFIAQQKLIESGDDEAMMPDWEFVEMLEYGMPPTFGFGCGERLFATLAGVSIREAQLFPLMRPKE